MLGWTTVKMYYEMYYEAVFLWLKHCLALKQDGIAL